jgi:hypothetical protein
MSDQIQPWPVAKRGSQGHPVPALSSTCCGTAATT